MRVKLFALMLLSKFINKQVDKTVTDLLPLKKPYATERRRLIRQLSGTHSCLGRFEDLILIVYMKAVIVCLLSFISVGLKNTARRD